MLRALVRNRNSVRRAVNGVAVLTTSIVVAGPAASPAAGQSVHQTAAHVTPIAGGESAVAYHTARVKNLDVFYREAGPTNAPTVLLLHGFPTSSHMYRNLIPALADRYHVIAPDYPGFGQSSMPSRAAFSYTFANLAEVIDSLTQQLGLDRYSLYVMDYGAPVGYRLALKHPERVQALIIQNGNAYEEGLREFWAPLKRYWTTGSTADRDSLRSSFTLAASRWQYTHGVRDTARIDPDNWIVDQYYLGRAESQEIQLDLFYDYRTNVELYPAFQAYFRRYQPPALIVWGKNDVIFPWQGAEPYKRDLKTVEYHLFDTGHFALEEHGDDIARLIRAFLAKHVPGDTSARTR